MSSSADRLDFSYRPILSVICDCIHTQELGYNSRRAEHSTPAESASLGRGRRCGAVRAEARAHGAGKEARPASGAPGSGSSAPEPGRDAPVGRWRRPGADLERRRVCALPPARARLPPPRVRRRRSVRTSSIRPDRPPAPRPSITSGGQGGGHAGREPQPPGGSRCSHRWVAGSALLSSRVLHLSPLSRT